MIAFSAALAWDIRDEGEVRQTANGHGSGGRFGKSS
jgi:hypothetical protein